MKTASIEKDYQEMAPDGAEVRLLLKNQYGSMVHCTLKQSQIARAVQHQTVSEFWHILSGRGELWRKKDGLEQKDFLAPGVSVDIPLGTAFQYRCTEGDLTFICVTVPPWPGDDECVLVAPASWHATID
jgi:mannose-6-phosphate isomerase-like protein (cupin superfamily)